MCILSCLYAQMYWLADFGDVSCLLFNYLRVETLTPTWEDLVGHLSDNLVGQFGRTFVDNFKSEVRQTLCPIWVFDRWYTWTIEDISIFSNSSHLEWRAGLSGTILKGTHQGTIPARFGLIWFSGYRGEDLNVIFYQNMPNLHNRYISVERTFSQKNQEYMLNYSLPCSCS